jgi:hypothetical protein
MWDPCLFLQGHTHTHKYNTSRTGDGARQSRVRARAGLLPGAGRDLSWRQGAVELERR